MSSIPQQSNKTFWIIGATSGIGKSVAIKLAQQGHQLILSGRRQENLNDIQKNFIPNAGLYPLDINDQQSVEDTYNKILNDYSAIDSIMFFSAQYEPMNVDHFPLKMCKSIIKTNYLSIFPILNLVVPTMKKQGYGQIVLCASVAGYIGLPNSQPYASTKAALINLAETMRCELRSDNIDVKIICPGFVKTEMTDKNSFAMPMMIDPDLAAERIIKQLDDPYRFEIKTHYMFTFIMKILKFLPYRIYFRLMKDCL